MCPVVARPIPVDEDKFTCQMLMTRRFLYSRKLLSVFFVMPTNPYDTEMLSKGF